MTSWQALGLGVGLGIGAGVTPGPLLGLIITETLRGGWRSGVLVAFAPPLGDVIVVSLCFLVLMRLPEYLLPVLGLGGGFYIVFLSWETFHTKGPTLPPGELAGVSHLRSLARGLIVNLLNPHPYIFWLTVAGPLVARSYQAAAFAPIVAFVAGFYGCLVGSKLVLALLIHGGRARLQGQGYQLTVRASGALLLVFGCMLIWRSVQQL